MGVRDEIDVHLVQMTNEEIDRDIAEAGFDAAVIDALSHLERDESRFWGNDGELKTKRS